MSFADVLLALLLLVAFAILALQVVLLRRGRTDDGLAIRLDALRGDGERLERVLREEQRAGREELQQGFDRFRGHVAEQLADVSRQQAERIDGFGQRLEGLTARTDAGLQGLAQRLTEDARKSREEVGLTLARASEQQRQQLASLTADNEKRMGEVRSTLEVKLKALQDDNAAKLEQMRATVDEKLQSTLETRLGQSFQLVSERLEQVHRGLGEMQSLANGVGDLKRVLSNVKSRGILGEVQLGALLEQLLTSEQYESNVITVPGSNERVEFAIRMPGQGAVDKLYLPIDAKFPVEDYQRLLEAQELADVEGAAVAGRALELRVREEAKRIRTKYVAAPHTTDFAVLFLPTEGLYAEVIRRPGLFELLQRDHRVVVAGPTTLSALLNSLQMGFRTLAIAQRSSEVWNILGAVKTEFGKFGDVLDKVKKKLDEAGRHIDATGVRTRAIERKLRGVETLSGEVTQQLLGVVPEPDDDVEEDTV
ncbi:DNA recombination protein RmuC [Frateuria edaphi]|jgi:DNA recombination protein RmuC|uniref:DNA recombination protein RmuC n=1 Tax=Frateuria TaxID=70411 RepID=UPI001E4C2985|nr:DNA recombination protein RmuC [Frateuria edaphi]UGB45272.1 DNA recombination protein RmuC [Frateuria edaphi]